MMNIFKNHIKINKNEKNIFTINIYLDNLNQKTLDVFEKTYSN